MDKPRVSPKDFFLWAAAMIALYVSVVSFIGLFFEYIDRAYPDALDYYVDPYSGAIRFFMASLIVLFPTFLILMRAIRRDIVRDAAKREIWVRRWALYLTVFIAGATIAIDLVTLINTFLGGDITARFILKVAIVLLVAAAGLMHFLADIWGYWNEFPDKARYVGYAAGLAVVLTVVGGFLIIGSPAQARLYRFDEQRVSDLSQIQYQIVNYWQQKLKLPQNLADLNDPLSGVVIPKDPQTGAAYEYRVVKAPYSFELCATFATDGAAMNAVAMPTGPAGSLDETWQHGSGHTCFMRTIDPQRYPPFTKGQAIPL
ncbi:MAG: hypothetical protein JO019_00475 [Candidatus Kaiserbacteria bacterium]|nr:hypothetical protein [Candidatus Kaiserbacteria bacterium]